MTRFAHDQFAKEYLEELLAPFGEVKAPRRVAGEVREIDVWFVKSPLYRRAEFNHEIITFVSTMAGRGSSRRYVSHA